MRSFAVRATVLALLLCAPALFFGILFGDDFFYHYLYNTFFDAQLRSGDVYPRWFFDGNAGLGAPVFFFYGSVPSFATSLFSWLTASVPHRMGLAAFAATLASGGAAYLWVRMLVPKPAASAAALLYMAHPYHLNIDLYVRFAYAEFWSFVWMPLVLASMVAIVHGRAHFWLLGAVAYAALIATHPPTVLIFTCVLIPYVACLLVTVPATDRPAIAMRMAGTLALGVALAGVYLVPALTTQHFASYAERLRHWDASFFMDYVSLWRTGLLISHAWRYSSDPGNMVYANVASFSLVVAALSTGVACFRARTRQARLWPVFWALVVVLSMVAMTLVSLPFWEFASGLQRIQFPTRLNCFLVLALVPLVGYAMAVVPAHSKWVPIAWLAIGLYAATFWTPTIQEIHWGLAKYTGVTPGAGILPPETRPATVPRALGGVDEITRLGETTPRAAFPSGAGSVSTTHWGPDGMVIETKNDQPDQLVVHQFFYPGWVVTTTPVVPVDIGASPEGLLVVRLPAGDYRVSIKRGKLKAEWIGLGITSAAVVAALAVLLTANRRRRRSHRPLDS